VDDSLLIRHAVRRFLEDRGYTVEVACDGMEGLAILDRFTPALIVTDLMMPKLSGADFVREIRRRPAFTNTNILVVAGRRGSTAPATIEGADHVIYKDIDLVEQLTATLDQIAVGQAAL
jgi:CheY-like chemotaxis protein